MLSLITKYDLHTILSSVGFGEGVHCKCAGGGTRFMGVQFFPEFGGYGFPVDLGVSPMFRGV